MYKRTPFRPSWLLLVVCYICAAGLPAAPQALNPAPLNIGQSFMLSSTVLGEERRINLYFPKAYFEQPDQPLPVLYMPDGGVHEDFVHIAGLVQIGSLNWTTRPVILVGIENTDRKRDLTGPTEDEEDKKISSVVGKSAEFRTFLRQELIPTIEQHYRTTAERGIIGESLAGLFVVETMLLEPDLFSNYIAVDPSLWWNQAALVKQAGERLKNGGHQGLRVHLAASSQQGIVEPTRQLAGILQQAPGLDASFTEFPDETHLSVYHPAALNALRLVYARE
ncbi:alpha/beta hydrolase [Bowmanella denitrificans]|uniref:alpha/beta hydrolase n=1 Tax=Bowmanella denitrificans TaxID=366582 RepID=UPI000C999BC8|nr:alpha/beta hydrolase-fold protein [Bowmanella denitrificans]